MLHRLKIPKLIRWIFSTGIIFLLSMTLLRLALFFFTNRQGHHFSDIPDALLLGLRYDLRVVAVLLLLLLITGSFDFLEPFTTNRGRWTWFFLMGVAAFLLIFFYAVDFAHFIYLSQRLNASILNYLGNAAISLRMVWQTYHVLWILFCLVLGTLMIRWMIVKRYKSIQRAGPVVSRRAKIFWSLACFVLLGLFIFGKIGQFPLRWSDAFALGDDYKANLALNPFQSFFSSLEFRHSGYDSVKVKEAFPVLAPYFGFPSEASDQLNYARRIDSKGSPSPGPPPNVVLVICESFSAYKSSMWGNPLNTTPFFNQLCNQGIFFDHCYTPSYGTARGVWAVVTGAPDVEVSTTTSSRNPAAVDQHTIINEFKGYEKFYFLGGSSSWANIRGLLTNNIKGLHLYEQQDYEAPKIDVWGISDKNLFLEANKVLKKQTKPFFAIIQTADNHRPYTIPEEDRQVFVNIKVPTDSLKQFGFESNDEMNAFRYTDFGYQKFFEAAGKESYFGNTIFLFVGDHGIPGNAGDMFPKAWTDQRLTAEHVPLLLYAPKLIGERHLSNLCSQIDVLPTLAGLCHIDYRNCTLGRDLLDSTYSAEKAFSFIYDPDQGMIGLVKGGFYYRTQIKGEKEEIVSVLNNNPVSTITTIDSIKKDLNRLTQGMYQTARYLIQHNQKKQ